MEAGRRNITARIMVAGGILIIAVFALGTIWMGRTARRDTEQAVRSVSLLYLDELAGRREQVVENNLNSNIELIRIAVGMLTEEDLSSAENLQSYQKQMKKLLNLEKFAFVSADGLMYTAEGMSSEIGRYAFDYTALDGPDISVRDAKNGEKTVVIAVPVDNIPFDDRSLVACFMEIDMRVMLKGVSLSTQSSGATYCNIYTAGGIPLSNNVLGGEAQENNLLTALSHAEFLDGYSLDQITADFAEGRKGVASFIYNGIRETIYYAPVEGTDWLLTYLIRESVISEQIGTVSDGIVRRSLIQSVLTAAVLGLLFAYIIIQIRKNASLMLEKETSEAENRAKHQGMEQRLALQEQLLAQKAEQEQQAKLITALASDYRSVYYLELDNDEGICYQSRTDLDGFKPGERFRYLESVSAYCSRYVLESYREEFMRFVQPDSIREGLKENRVISFRYMICVDGRESYEAVRFAGVRHPEDRDDHLVHTVGACFTDVDAETRKTLEDQQVLSEALTAAEQANRAKTAFLSNMSHEIRTPMNAIIGLDSLALRNTSLPEETREYLEKIGGSARHLLGLINDILDMSRIESGRMVLRKEEFSLREMLEQINTMVLAQCGEKGLEYECSVIGGVSDYYIGDAMKLKQVLINMLSNAIKFTNPPGSVRLTVERTAEYEGQSTLEFVVKDTGIGMDKSFIPKIFDSFTQENSNRNNKYGSTGLGMAITKNIVTLMNGTISVESEKGVGSKFTVVITLKDSDREGSGTRSVNPKDMRVLIVDDEEIAAEHARIILDEVGIASDTCLSGPEALNMMEIAHTKHRPYNLVLLDWKMPEMDGIELARQIRLKYSRETTIIILTSFNWDEIMDEALHIGVDSFLTKPLFASNVIDEFERIVRKNNMDLRGEKKRASLKGRRILLAEDILINAEILRQLLMMKEAEIDHAENGRLALELFSRSPAGYYAAILMDVRMPEMDGLEATKAIRALGRDDAGTIPIIALTANAFDEDVQSSMQVGMNAHLSKPVEPEQLYQTLEELIWEAER